MERRDVRQVPLEIQSCTITKVENVNKVCVEEEIQRSSKCRRKKRGKILNGPVRY